MKKYKVTCLSTSIHRATVDSCLISMASNYPLPASFFRWYLQFSQRPQPMGWVFPLQLNLSRNSLGDKLRGVSPKRFQIQSVYSDEPSPASLSVSRHHLSDIRSNSLAASWGSLLFVAVYLVVLLHLETPGAPFCLLITTSTL